VKSPSGPATVTGERACDWPLFLNPRDVSGKGDGKAQAAVIREPGDLPGMSSSSSRGEEDDVLEDDGKVLGLSRGLFYFG